MLVLLSSPLAFVHVFVYSTITAGLAKLMNNGSRNDSLKNHLMESITEKESVSTQLPFAVIHSFSVSLFRCSFPRTHICEGSKNAWSSQEPQKKNRLSISVKTAVTTWNDMIIDCFCCCQLQNIQKTNDKVWGFFERPMCMFCRYVALII